MDMKEFLLKEHTSTDQVLEDFYEVIDSDFYINEADGDPLPMDLPQGGEMQEAPPSDMMPGEEQDLAQQMDAHYMEQQQGDPMSQQMDGMDDAVGKDSSIDNKKEKKSFDVQSALINNIKHIITIRSLLDDLIGRTSDKRFISFRTQSSKVLSSVAGEGKEILKRDDVEDINNRLSFFITQVIDNCLFIIKKDYSKKETGGVDNVLTSGFDSIRQEFNGNSGKLGQGKQA